MPTAFPDENPTLRTAVTVNEHTALRLFDHRDGRTEMRLVVYADDAETTDAALAESIDVPMKCGSVELAPDGRVLSVCLFVRNQHDAQTVVIDDDGPTVRARIGEGDVTAHTVPGADGVRLLRCAVYDDVVGVRVLNPMR